LDKHETVPRLKKVEQCRHAWKAELTDKDGSVKASLAFFSFYDISALLIHDRKSLENCGER
jgi:hypothetical protein